MEQRFDRAAQTVGKGNKHVTFPASHTAANRHNLPLKYSCNENLFITHFGSSGDSHFASAFVPKSR